ncbi:MAG: hypothetical protein KC543_09480 [Myxococcales bacterium]|nr:hypothetical protein [Myxococcales bacterium]
MRVVLDADARFPFTLRDALLRAAALGMYQVHWSAEILDEAARNLIATGRMNKEQAAHLMAAMRNACATVPRSPRTTRRRAPGCVGAGIGRGREPAGGGGKPGNGRNFAIPKSRM